MPRDGLVVVMGVSGVGKTATGRRVAALTGFTFVDADWFHRPVDLARMSAGEPLTDEQRRPWIERLHRRLIQAAARGEPVVLACSALRAEHREMMVRGLDGVRWFHLCASENVIRQRLEQRGHGPGPALLDSQLATMEIPDDAVEVDAEAPTEVVAAAIVRELAADSSTG